MIVYVSRLQTWLSRSFMGAKGPCDWLRFKTNRRTVVILWQYKWNTVQSIKNKTGNKANFKPKEWSWIDLIGCYWNKNKSGRNQPKSMRYHHMKW